MILTKAHSFIIVKNKLAPPKLQGSAPITSKIMKKKSKHPPFTEKNVLAQSPLIHDPSATHKIQARLEDVQKKGMPKVALESDPQKQNPKFCPLRPPASSPLKDAKGQEPNTGRENTAFLPKQQKTTPRPYTSVSFHHTRRPFPGEQRWYRVNNALCRNNPAKGLFYVT